MSKRTLNDTAAITAQPSERGYNQSVNTRKIDNGYVISQSGCDPKTGEYKYSEQFSATPPVITPGKVTVGASPDKGNPLSDTMKYLNNDR